MYQLSAIGAAFANLADPFTILMLVLGLVLGLAIGILPGLGPPIAIALALPFTFYMEPVPSLVLLLAIYNAAIYGRSISAVTVGIPGTGAAIATVMDGNAMFKQGRGGEALGLSLVGSIIGGLVSAVALTFITPLLAQVAIKFGRVNSLRSRSSGLSSWCASPGPACLRGFSWALSASFLPRGALMS